MLLGMQLLPMKLMQKVHLLLVRFLQALALVFAVVVPWQTQLTVHVNFCGCGLPLTVCARQRVRPMMPETRPKLLGLGFAMMVLRLLGRNAARLDALPAAT